MNIVSIAFAIVTTYATFWALYVLAMPLIARVGGGKHGGIEAANVNLKGAYPTIAVLLPAHNMAHHVSRCIDSLHVSGYPHEKLEVFVIADHCTDDTVKLAQGANATVLVREVGPRGKTYAIAWALDTLEQLGINPDIYVIVDATASVDIGFLEQLAIRNAKGEDIVIGHPVVDPENQLWFARCLGLTLTHRNLQSMAREQLGLSVFISGRGMAFSRRYIKRYGWSLALPTTPDSGSHPTEDWRHGVRIVENGFRAAFADNARVYTPLRESLGAATKQGLRWERGRIANAATHALRLMSVGIRQRSVAKVIAALDAMQPPVAILGGVCVAIAAGLLVYSNSVIAMLLGSIPLALIVVYGLIVVIHGRREGIEPKTLLWAPVYVAWRCAAFLGALARLDRLSDASSKKSNDRA